MSIKLSSLATEKIKNLQSKKIQKKKIRFILNPRAGKKDKENIEQIIKEKINPNLYKYDFCMTQKSGHAAELSEEAKLLKYDAVIAIGGDGTVNEVSSALINTDIALGILPKGSGNGLARHLKLPFELEKALEVINQYNCLTIDTLKINNKSFLGVAGIGFDAYIAWQFSSSKKRGLGGYVNLICKSYLTFKPQSFELMIDGNKVVKEALLLSFANISQYGNDIKIAAGAKIDDGYLQVVILKKPLLPMVPIILRMLKKGNIQKSKYYESFLCKEVVIEEKNIKGHIDGEPILFSKGLKIKINPKSLKVIVP